MSNINDKAPEIDINNFMNEFDEFMSGNKATTTEPAQEEKPDYDFDVVRQPVFTRLPNGESLILPKNQTLVRTDTLKVVGQCSPNYKLVKHTEVMEKLNTALKEVGIDYSEKTTVTNEGARLFNHITFEGIDTSIEGQSVAPQIIMLNCYDGSSKFDIDLGAYRSVCSNGMRLGESFVRAARKRTQGLNVDAIISRITTHLINFKSDVIPFWNALTEYEASKEEGQKIITDIGKKSIFGERNTEKVINQWNRDRSPVTGGRNAWGIYNAFTSVITHEVQTQSFENGHRLGRKIMPCFEALVS